MSASPAQDCARPPSAKLLAPGDMVEGRYRVEAYLGGGGMASVYRATHVVLEQPVAIKVICALIREVPGTAQRFLREARAATQLKSEHVARVSDVGTMPDGAPFMVMEYLDGRDLDALIQSGEDVSVEEAVDYVLQACEALAEVHGLGIVHRDLKPANLFLTRGADGLPCVKLIDFGISRTDSPLSPKDVVGLTQPDMVMGSPRYMSPEQMESASKADCRSDIYGIGAVLYELLTKKAPHEGETFLDIYAAATMGPPVPPSELRTDIPRALDAVILRCLRIEPMDRYGDTAELAAALAPFGPEGSVGRAEAIARILEAARSRTRDGGAHEEAVFLPEGSGSSSKVRRRGAPSARTTRRHRIVRRTLTAAALVVVGLVFGGRAIYSRGQANGIATATSPVPVVALPPPVVTPIAPVASQPPAPTATGTSPPVVAPTEARGDVPRSPLSASFTNTSPFAGPAVPSPLRRAPAAEPSPAFTPAPDDAPPRPLPPPPAVTRTPDPASEERRLFEERK